MKKQISLSIAILLSITLIIVVLALLGFKITYNPNLDNNWEAISACAGWAAVLASGLSICFAISVPYKIANSQNKIALFEKRYSVYMQLQKCVMYGEILNFNIGNIGPGTINFLFL